MSATTKEGLTIRVQRGLQQSGAFEEDPEDIVGEKFRRGGDTWEEVILNKLDSHGHKVWKGDAPHGAPSARLSDAKIDFDAFLKILETLKPDDKSGEKRYFIYQPTLIAVPSFSESLGLQRSSISFSACYPDFIEVAFEKTSSPDTFDIKLTVIDAKATDSLKLSHRVQVALYVMMLRHLIGGGRVQHVQGVNISVNMTGGVWLRDHDDYTTFDLEPVIRFLLDFLSSKGRLGKMLNSGASSLRSSPWHLEKKCQYCPYKDYCRSSATRNGKSDLSLIYKIGRNEKILAGDFLRQQTGNIVYDIEDAHKVFSKYEDPTADAAKRLLLNEAPTDAAALDLTEKLANLSITAPVKDPLHNVDALAEQLITKLVLDTSAAEAPASKDDKHTSPASSSSAESSDSETEDTNTQEEPPLVVRHYADFTPSSPAPGTPIKSLRDPNLLDMTPSKPSIEVPPSPFTSVVHLKTKKKSTTRSGPARKKNSEKLSRELWIIKKRIEAWTEKRVVPFYRASHELPDSEDLAIFISVQMDKPMGHLFYWSIYLCGHKKTIVDRIKKFAKTALAQVLSSVQDDQDDQNGAAVRSQLVEDGLVLWQMLGQSVSHAHPMVSTLETRLTATLHSALEFAATGLAQKDTVATYTWNASEASELKSILSAVAGYSTQRVRVQAAILLNTLFDSSDAITRFKQPSLEKDVSHRIVSIKSVIEKLVALPVSFDSDFTEFSRAILSLKPDPAAAAVDLNGLDSGSILSNWYYMLQAGSTMEPLVSSLEKRILVLDRIISTFRQFLQETLPLSLPRKAHPFAFRTTLFYQNPTLSKLSFVLQYEIFNSAVRKMEDRTSVLCGAVGANQLVEERIAILRFVDTVDGFTPVMKKKKIYHKFKCDVLSENVRSDLMNQIEKNQSIKNWMVSSASPESLKAALAFNDYVKRVRPGKNTRFSFIPPSGVAFARIVRINESRKSPEIVLELSMGKQMPDPVKDAVYFMSPIEVDLVGTEAQSSLQSLDYVWQFQSVLLELSKTDPDFLLWLMDAARSALAIDGPIKVLPDDPKAQTLSSIASRLHLMTAERAAALRAKKTSASTQAAPAAEAAPAPQLAPEPTPAPATDVAPPPSPENPDSVTSTADEQPAMLEFFPEVFLPVILEAIVSAIRILLGMSGSVPFSILGDPLRWGLEVPTDVELQDQCLQIASRVEGRLFTAAQREVFQHMLSRRLQCVWGPPGSGKTHFAATAVAIVAEARMAEAAEAKAPGKPFRVLVTAFTHASIDNLVERIMERQAHLLEILRVDNKDQQQNTRKRLPISRLVNKSSISSTRFAELQRLPDSMDDGDADEAESKPTPANSGEATEELSVGSSASPAKPTTPSRRGRGGAKRGGAAAGSRRPAFHRPIFPQVNPQICFADNPSEVTEMMEEHPQIVVAGTVWAIRKAFKSRLTNPPEFDLVIVDEASQLLLAHVLEPLKYLSKNGRLVVAGDHLQLPPIINAEYPNVPSGEPIFHSSIFDYLQSLDVHSACTDMLYENWRMNEVLCRLPSERIYKSQVPERAYRPATPQVATQKFYTDRISKSEPIYRFSSVPKTTFNILNPMFQLALDSSKSMVVFRLKSQSGLSLEPFPQGPLVASLIGAIRRICQYEFPSESDISFWAKRLLVVAPHHVQRQVIRTHLRERHAAWQWPWEISQPPSIETVEKSQGREFDSVIIDYGIMDPFRVSRELKFLYSRNRLNVAQSRSKVKCILFISDTLLNIQKNIFLSPAIEAGLSYMQSCVEYARQQQSYMEVDVDQIDEMVSSISSEPIFKPDVFVPTPSSSSVSTSSM